MVEQTRVTSAFHADGGFSQGDPDNPTPVGPIEPATESEIGGVMMMPNIPDLSGAPTQQDFNDLLAALQAAGMMAAP